MKKLKVPKMTISRVKTYQDPKPEKEEKKKKKEGKIIYRKTKGLSQPNSMDINAMLKQSMTEGAQKKRESRRKKVKTWSKGY